MDYWTIAGHERAKHDQQFYTCNPVNGYITGEQARNFFMQSGLPSTVLAQIWNLADLDHDGYMDRKEFSIAMFLIQKKLQGFTIPSVLPSGLLHDPDPVFGSVPGGATLPHHGYGGPPVPPQPSAYSAHTMPHSYAASQPYAAAPSHSPRHYAPPPVPPQPVDPYYYEHEYASHSFAPSGGAVDWTMPESSKLKSAQLFNQLDKGRTGALSGVHARNIMSQSGLPTTTLAAVWQLADLDQDGLLTCDEFCIAMFLIDMAKAGHSMPLTLPAAVLASTTKGRVYSSSDYDSMRYHETSFEDRRRENFDKGQAELERRRALLMEQERKEREERDRKEQAERERMERLRMEEERRRQIEMEQEQQRQALAEQQHLEEQRKLLEQREVARRELERARKLELDKQKAKQLGKDRQNTEQQLCHAKQKQKNMQFQLQALDEKSTETNENITKMRNRIVEVTTEIETMKIRRDEKVSVLDALKKEIQQTQQKLTAISTEKARALQERKAAVGKSSVSDQYSQVMASFQQHSTELSSLRIQLNNVTSEAEGKKELLDERRDHMKNVKHEYEGALEDYNKLFDTVTAKQQEAHTLLTTEQQQQQPTAAVDTPMAVQAQSPQAATVKYRALYEFQARNDDELSFQPGDTILVFKDHHNEPGWLAGQVRNKVGWFPEAFAECLERADGDAAFNNAATVVSPSGSAAQKLDRIEEDDDHTAAAAGHQNGFGDAGGFGDDFGAAPAADDPFANAAVDPFAASNNDNDAFGANFDDDFGASADDSTAAPTSVPSAADDRPAAEMIIALATYPWKAKKDEHLSFQKGDAIRILEQQEMWWLGELNGQRGWLPKSCVRPVEGEKKTKLMEQLGLSASTSHSDAPAAAAASSSEGEWFVAVYPFAAAESGDLGFEAGERILVSVRDGDWWTGTCADRQGIFPASYVQKEEAVTNGNGDGAANEEHHHHHDTQPATANDAAAPQSATVEIGKVIAPFTAGAANQLSLKQGDMVSIRSKSPTGWFEGELQRKGEQRKTGWFPGNYIKILSKGSGSAAGQPGAQGDANVVEAVFDYAALHDDELSFAAGQTIVIVEKKDDDWWLGHLQDAPAKQGLFPSNYVQPANRLYDAVPDTQQPSSLQHDTRSHRHLRELIDTEKNYADDLCMVDATFGRGLSGVLSAAERQTVFGNWQQLIANAQQLYRALADDRQRPGKVLLSLMPQLQAFVVFCERQQMALDFIHTKLAADPQFSAAYTQCCQQPAARGLNLAYFLLLPMTRVTKYPLTVAKLLEFTDPADADYQSLSEAHVQLKALVTRVNDVVSEWDNLQLLCWCQQHIRAPSLQPPVVFNAATNTQPARCWLHSGLLYKSKSQRLLVGVLFNDFLLLAQPADALTDVRGFKLSRQSDVQLLLYKQPLLLQHIRSVTRNTDGDTAAFSLLLEDASTLAVRAVDGNAAVLWTKQLSKAVAAAKTAHDAIYKDVRPPAAAKGAGRLLFELVSLSCPQLLPADFGNQPFRTFALLQLPNAKQVKWLDFSRAGSESLCSTQFTIEDTKSQLRLALYVYRAYTPNVRIGTVKLLLSDLIKTSSTHRGPVSRQVALNKPLPGAAPTIVVKFVVQMFD